MTIALIVFGILALVLLIPRITTWRRRTGRYNIDFETLVKYVHDAKSFCHC